MLKKNVFIMVALLTSPLLGREVCNREAAPFGTMDCAIAERAAKLIPDLIKRFAEKKTDLYFERISSGYTGYPLLVYTFETNQMSKMTRIEHLSSPLLKLKGRDGRTTDHVNVPTLAKRYELPLDPNHTSFVMLPTKINGKNSMIVVGVLFNQKLKSAFTGSDVQAFFHAKDVIIVFYKLGDFPHLLGSEDRKTLTAGKCGCKEVTKCSRSAYERVVNLYPHYASPWVERCIEYQFTGQFFRSENGLKYESLNECQEAIKKDSDCANFPWVMD